MTLFLTNESKETIKKLEEPLSKIRELVFSITKNSEEYDEKIKILILAYIIQI